jgi:extracellular factor (EF) 3-hydroxypalmitic acid methyl ester biosynthesis protein
MLLGFEREISRTVSFKTSRGKTVRGTLHNVSRRNVVFEIYDPFLVLRTSEVLTGFQVRRGRDALYQGEAVVTNVVNNAILLVVSATLSGEWNGLEVSDRQARNMLADAEAFVGDWERQNRITPSYRLKVGELKSFMNDLRYWLDHIDLTREIGSPTERPQASISDHEFDAIKQPVMPKLTEAFMGLELACRDLDRSNVDIHKQLAQRELLPLMMPSPFFNRVFTKPLGYAGDYEMVNMMFRNMRGGLTTYAQVVDDWLLAGGPPEAHRNRIYTLERVLNEIAETSKTRNKPIRIMNIGCGPAQELQLFLAQSVHAHRFEIDLMDFNAETLAFTRQKLTPLAEQQPEKPTINYKLKSVQDLLRQAIERAEAPEPYDFIYCAGLFDYLSDRVCSKLVHLFYSWCDEGGRLLVTNVHTSNPVQGLMEHVMEWHLVLRDEESMMRLSPDSDHSKVYRDTTGINVFLDVYKPFSGNGSQRPTDPRV